MAARIREAKSKDKGKAKAAKKPAKADNLQKAPAKGGQANYKPKKQADLTVTAPSFTGTICNA